MHRYCNPQPDLMDRWKGASSMHLWPNKVLMSVFIALACAATLAMIRSATTYAASSYVTLEPISSTAEAQLLSPLPALASFLRSIHSKSYAQLGNLLFIRISDSNYCNKESSSCMGFVVTNDGHDFIVNATCLGDRIYSLDGNIHMVAERMFKLESRSRGKLVSQFIINGQSVFVSQSPLYPAFGCK